MFKKRSKRSTNKKSGSSILQSCGLEASRSPSPIPKEHIPHPIALPSKKKPGISLSKTLSLTPYTNFGLQNGRDDDLSDYTLRESPNLGKRVLPTSPEPELKKDEVDILARLSDIHNHSKKIKEENKSKALWSTGIIEVEVGTERKLQNIEQTEALKRDRIIDEILDKVQPKRMMTVSRNEDLRSHLWRPKDEAKEKRKKEKLAEKQFLQSFKKEGRGEARKQWNGFIEGEGNRDAFHYNN